MDTVRLGRTGITVNKNGFGALPVQRVDVDTAAAILRRAYESGINYFDTARAYSDSEHKIGVALGDVRDKIHLASKTMASTVEGFWADLHASLEALQTGYIDVYQFHTPPFCPLPEDGTGLYEAMQEAKAKGLIRHIALTNHRLAVAQQAVDSGLYDLIQFPFNYLSGAAERALVQSCRENDVGFVAMKGLSGGLITNVPAIYAWMLQYDNVLPIWGVQHMWELEQFLAGQEKRPILDETLLAAIQKDIDELAGEFCRGCGYCMPCPVDIEIHNAARISLLLRRSPAAGWVSDVWQQKMHKIQNCLSCGQCAKKCPYGLDTPALLQKNYADWLTFLPEG